MRELTLVILVCGCAFPNPMSDAKEWCERISGAEQGYLARCKLEPSAPPPNCKRVWDVSASDEQLGQCVADMDHAECGSLADWPASCPRQWMRLPWE